MVWQGYLNSKNEFTFFFKEPNFIYLNELVTIIHFYYEMGALKLRFKEKDLQLDRHLPLCSKFS
jgi:hypothetical protein